MASLRILCDIMLPNDTVRLWDGSGGLYVDDEGEIYRAAQFTDDALQSIEAAINGEAFTLSLSLTNVSASAGDAIWEYDETSSISGSPFILKLQEMDDAEQPVGSPEIKFTGTIDNLDVIDQAAAEESTSVVTIEVVNAFTLRTSTHGGVLSDVDQRARSARLNPGAPADCSNERIPGLRDKTIRWPNW
ncbi:MULTISPECIES: hypothetical protein [Agrobacterium]|uniref:hypothetical protein n=1 Tax=Agrobacterium TaxID=357 RepID=UPI0027898A06|nr:hypothetical protein [Agrobacterium sp. SORGH_AS_0745]MDP9758325.1 hypothetical protein [Agrobacterium tumefaciens]MDQ1219565.1 hypothetical protein [Agrobacterium sp. SORGH_AS_0745]